MSAITASRAVGLSIGKLSQLTGVNIETIRYYEKVKVLPVASRAENGRRVYGPTETRILAFVRRSRDLGFSLDVVRALLRLGGPEKARLVKSGRLPRITSTISAPRSATSVGWNAY